MRRAFPYLVLALALALVVGSRWGLRAAGVEVSFDRLDEVRAWIADLGWWGPAIFLALVAGRTFLFLTSQMVLPLGGLAFGALGGTILGAVGLTLNALIMFALARVLGNEWVRPRIGARGVAFERRIEQAGGWVVSLVTAHPAGPLTAMNVGAGLSTLPVARFVVPVALAAPIRSALYSALGDSVVDAGAARATWLLVVLLAASLLPLAFPRVRAWVLGRA
jgi:uncharacterized membrane protein YdjX (TVP38/TMEM64 family)